MTTKENCLTGEPINSYHGYNPEFYEAALFQRRVAAQRRKQDARLENLLKPDRLVPLPSPTVPLPHMTGRPTLMEIKRRVCFICDVSQEEIESVRREERIVTARHMFGYLAKKYTSSSFPQIGKALGGQDHSTILHSTRNWPNRKKKLRKKKVGKC